MFIFIPFQLTEAWKETLPCLRRALTRYFQQHGCASNNRCFTPSRLLPTRRFPTASGKAFPVLALSACLFVTIFANAVAKSAPITTHAANSHAKKSSGAPPAASAAKVTQLSPITVLAKFNSSRQFLFPSIGSSIYAFTPEALKMLPLGHNTSIQQLLTQAPGVNQDSFDQIHIRGNMANVQYRLNGIYLPAELTGFGSALSPLFARDVTLLTGALPAEYGFDTSAIVNITTPNGAEAPGGSVSLRGGSHNTWQPSLDWGGSAGRFSWYVTGSYLRTDLGISSPTTASTPLHDFSHQANGFGYFSYILNDDQRLIFTFGDSVNHFQIPNNPGQPAQYGYEGYTPEQLTMLYPSADLNENQREANRFGLLALQGDHGALSYQFSFFNRFSNVTYYPDPIGDLVYSGISPNIYRSSMENGLQADFGDVLNSAHTLRFGFIASRQHAANDNTAAVFPADSEGNQTSDIPFSITDNYSNLGWLYGVYVQDEWSLTPALTLNYGARADEMDYFGKHGQISPRINAVYKLGDATTFHAGYARYFTPPSLDTISQSNIEAFENTTGALPTNVNTIPLPQRANYFDAGVQQRFGAHWTAGLDAYYETLTDVLDLGQFGEALVYSDFNYAKGRIHGLELTGNFSNGNWSVYGNLSYISAEAKDVVTGQYNFEPDELAYIQDHYIRVDHAQQWTLTTGASYRWNDTLLSTTVIYGSGYPTGFANLQTLPGYITLNAAISHTWNFPGIGTINTRFSVINVFDRVYEIRDGSGVGAGAPQYLPRRGFYLTVGKSF